MGTFGPEWVAYKDADDRWSAELGRLFGDYIGDVRYTSCGHGAPDTMLRALYDDYVAKRAAWYAALDVPTVRE